MEWFKLFSGDVVLMMVDLFSLQVMQVQGGMGKGTSAHYSHKQTHWRWVSEVTGSVNWTLNNTLTLATTTQNFKVAQLHELGSWM